MFHLVKNTIIVIGWVMTLGHSWFNKHQLRQIKHLTSNLGHRHIFIAMFKSAGQYLIFYFNL
jgi:hypothetical protein